MKRKFILILLLSSCLPYHALTQSFSVSSAVRWTQTSAEYELITRSLFKKASESMERFYDSSEPWVVFIDVDETLLDNSEYNRRRDILGKGFTLESWASWVKEESATAVPGAKNFVSSVLENGGQIALITNRDRELDQHTWNNLVQLGFPFSRTNTCILGRTQADKDAVGSKGVINDKDLRRNNVLNGDAENCWSNFPEAKDNWNKELQLVMQVGDNIQDIAKITQDSANIEELLKRQGADILILPNAMYGSWE